MGLTQQEALDLFRSDDLVGIGMAAMEVRRKKTDPRVVTYQIDRNINYTNFCTEYCSFCAFYRPLGSKEGYLLSFESIYEKIEEMIELGGTGILLQGGLHPDLRVEYYENLLRSLKAAFSASPSALFFRAGNRLHRGSFRPERARDDRAPDGRGARLDPRRRRGNSRRRNSRAHLAPQVHLRRMGRHAPRRPLARHAHHRHDDVRLRRGVPPPRQSSRAPAPHPGRYRRLHRVHPVDVRAGQYAARQRKSRKPPPSIT